MKYWSLFALAIGVAALAGIVIGKAVPTQTGVGNPVVMAPLLLGVWGLVFASTWLWWKRTDDLQQQGQLVSWWWGGMSGTVAIMVYLLMFYGRHSELTLGASYLVFGQGAGFVMAWLIWRFRGRGEPE
ncbi:hypothetical protein [Blastomonas sp.]|uniref:hypothetical protein n=1 Tax=Blastomonas sp. TaxID=1909299 RepID=UPI00262D715E|nr:hypothetical protein [Blastomonas sp.]MDM7955075.1 hypothetical protein [Blastomonas sp.]